MANYYKSQNLISLLLVPFQSPDVSSGRFSLSGG
jgi:hypothetical protein